MNTHPLLLYWYDLVIVFGGPSQWSLKLENMPQTCFFAKAAICFTFLQFNFNVVFDLSFNSTSTLDYLSATQTQWSSNSEGWWLQYYPNHLNTSFSNLQKSSWISESCLGKTSSAKLQLHNNDNKDALGNGINYIQIQDREAAVFTFNEWLHKQKLKLTITIYMSAKHCVRKIEIATSISIWTWEQGRNRAKQLSVTNRENQHVQQLRTTLN